MVGIRPFRPNPPRPFIAQRVVIIRSAFAFLGSMLFCYLVATRLGSITALLALVFLWLVGALGLLEHIFRFVSATGEESDYHDLLRRADIMLQPITQKESSSGENAWLSYGFCCMQGWRRTMEDDHVIMLNDDGGFFGVFDGHSGSNVARFCGENLYKFISKTQAFEERNFTKALYDGFIATDKHLHANFSNERSGCTAVVLLVKENDLYCGNAGDSRCILCRDGGPFPLSNDHKPFLPGEQNRIERAGGYVWNRRVNGALALSRAIGDFGFKNNTQVSWDQQAVTSAPEVRYSRLNRDRDEFAVIACDGIWDVMTNEQVVDFVRQSLQRRVPLPQIAEDLVDQCLSPNPFGLGCDNMSVIILQFKRPTPGMALRPLEGSEVPNRPERADGVSVETESVTSNRNGARGGSYAVLSEEFATEGNNARENAAGIENPTHASTETKSKWE